MLTNTAKGLNWKENYLMMYKVKTIVCLCHEKQENLDAFSVSRVRQPRLEVIAQKEEIARLESPAQIVEALKRI